MHDKYLNRDELEHFTQAIRSEPDLKYRLYFLTLLHTGARCSEVLNLTTEDLMDDAVRIRGLKGSNDRIIPLPLELMAQLNLQSGPILFQFSARYARRRFKRYLPAESRKSLHAIRHTVGVHSYRKFKDIQLTRQLLGHRNIQNTQVYVDYNALLDAGDKITKLFD